MPTLTIHDLPDRLHARLAARAAANRRTVDAEARAVLDEALAAEPAAAPETDAERAARVEAALASLAALRRSMVPVPDEMDPVRIIREGRDSGYGRDWL